MDIGQLRPAPLSTVSNHASGIAGNGLPKESVSGPVFGINAATSAADVNPDLAVFRTDSHKETKIDTEIPTRMPTRERFGYYVFSSIWQSLVAL